MTTIREDARRAVDAALNPRVVRELLDGQEVGDKTGLERDLRDVLASYFLAEDAVDRNRIREANKTLGDLRHALAAARILLRKAEHELGVMDLASCSPGKSPERAPPGLAVALEKTEHFVAGLCDDAKKSGAPRKDRTGITIVYLARLLDSYGGKQRNREEQRDHATRRARFARKALALIGVKVSLAHVREVIAKQAKSEASVT